MAESWKPDSLVEYDNPVMVTAGAAKETMTIGDEEGEILHAILPPRQWEQDGQLWQQKVSSNPATREKVQNLAEEFDMRLNQRHARETGIYELIRQTTISCSEAGLLLARVRNELQMTLDTYCRLYESAIAFGIRKALQSAQGQEELEEAAGALREQIRGLDHELAEERARNERAQQRWREKHDAEEKKHREEVLSYKKANQQLKAEMKQRLDGVCSSLLLYLCLV
ncbi:hypothetical protein B566_EDAN002418 [Ephemera danica]|nr:hypothetical protein B566_EDAN002418 [Ephemera danica]